MSLSDSTGWPKGAAPLPALCGEDARAEVVASYGVSALHDDEELSGIAAFAAPLCGCPVALVTMVEPERQVFLARSGTELSETPRSVSFCAHAMLGGEPMVVPDATEDPRFADNALVTGEEHVRFYAGVPLITPEGAPLGALCVIDREPRPGGLSKLQRQGLEVLAKAVMRRLESRRLMLETNQEAEERARHMRGIADLVPAIVWSADERGRFDYFNRRWRDLTGKSGPNSLEDWRKVVHAEDHGAALAEWRRCFASGEPFESEFRVIQRDGTWRWVISRALPFKGPDGAITRWYGTLTDIDEGRRLSQSRDLLARELSHRIKNIFAVVAGLISIRARRRPEMQDFADELVGAIRALGRAHDFVRPIEGAKGDSLHGLLAELMAPYAGGDDRVTIQGNDCRIGPRAATPLALVFHELATNSAKYGAFSVEDGKIEITIDYPDGDTLARVLWRERCGPIVVDAGHEGFGSRLITMAVEGQLGGTLERRFTPEGLEVDLTMKVEAIRS